MPIPEDFKKLLPPPSIVDEPYRGPIYFLWSHDPQSDSVHLIHNDNTHPALHKTHADIAKDIAHPDRTDGYAYKIRGGFRITDAEHRPLDDPHIARKVHTLLRGHTPKPALPHIPYHGSPIPVI